MAGSRDGATQRGCRLAGPAAALYFPFNIQYIQTKGHARPAGGAKVIHESGSVFGKSSPKFSAASYSEPIVEV